MKPAKSRSSFVTSLAWTFIAFGGLSTLIGLLQIIVLTAILPADEIGIAMQDANQAQQIPGPVQFMLSNLHLIFLLFLAISVATLISAVGLLKRRNWARLVFIGVMAVGVLSNLAGLAFPFLVSSWLPDMTTQAPPDFKQEFDFMWNITTGLVVVTGLVFAGLFAWIIKRLMSPEIKSEFVPS